MTQYASGLRPTVRTHIVVKESGRFIVRNKDNGWKLGDFGSEQAAEERADFLNTSTNVKTGQGFYCTPEGAKPLEFSRGDRVLYSGAWGSHAPQPGKITGKGEKNGRTVYDVDLDNGNSHWGYADQFTAVRS
jgi:hypothetical protein